jgi:hypothetical protein
VRLVMMMVVKVKMKMKKKIRQMSGRRRKRCWT